MNTPQPSDQAIAAVVAGLLKDLGISQKAASELARIPRVTLIRRLSGEPFRIDELRRLAAVLNTTTPAILAAAEQVAA